jgi:hypothetical protein
MMITETGLDQFFIMWTYQIDYNDDPKNILKQFNEKFEGQISQVMDGINENFEDIPDRSLYVFKKIAFALLKEDYSIEFSDANMTTNLMIRRIRSKCFTLAVKYEYGMEDIGTLKDNGTDLYVSHHFS